MDIFKNTDLTDNLDVGHVGEVAHKLAEQWINDNGDLVDGIAQVTRCCQSCKRVQSELE